MDCQICCEPYDKKTHLKINCGFCDYDCCRDCVQSYISSRPEIPNCMKCNHEWSRQFLMSVCTKTFINREYKQHREQFLFEREQSRLPEAQQLIQLQNQHKTLADEIQQLNLQIESKLIQSRRLVNMIETRDITNTDPTQRRFVKRCPLESCRGFLNTRWKCGVCEKNICSKCHELKEDNHECNPDNVASAELIKKESKPCPKCGIYITKIDGCDQMWCTDCHTAFSWRSGIIIKGRIHNPHFYEARRFAGIQMRDVNDIPCGGLPSHQELLSMGFSEISFPRLMIPFVCYVEGLIQNIREPDTMRHRINYLKGLITEEKFKKLIQQNDKRYHKEREINDIYQMLVTTISDILRQIVIGDISAFDAESNVINILNYSNDAIKNVHKKYNSKASNILYFKFYEHTSRYYSSTYLRLTFNPKRIKIVDTIPSDEFKFTKMTFIPPGGGYTDYTIINQNY